MDFFPDHLRSKKQLRKDAERLADSGEADKIGRSSRTLSGESEIKQAGSGYQFWQFKPYVAGEEIRSIDWRASAKSEQPLVRERELTTHRVLNICPIRTESLKFSSNGQRDKSYFVSLISLTCGIWASRNDYQIKFHGHQTNPDELEYILQESEYLQNLQSGRNEALLLVSDFIDDFKEFKQSMDLINHSKVIIVQCLDAAEINFPYRGRIAFNSGNENLTIDTTSHLAKNYQVLMQQHIYAVQSYAGGRGWFYGLVRSDEFPQVTFRELTEYLRSKS